MTKKISQIIHSNIVRINKFHNLLAAILIRIVSNGEHEKKQSKLLTSQFQLKWSLRKGIRK